MYQDHDAPPYRRDGRSFYSAMAAFPIACFVLTLLTDLAYWRTASFIWETVSVWLLVAGLFGAGLALIAGIADLVRSRRMRGLAQPVARIVCDVVVVALSVVNVLVHSRDGYTAVVPLGLILSALVVLILIARAFSGRVAPRPVRAEGHA